jgi:transposase-like protein
LQGKELQVAKRKRRVWRFPDDFRAQAVQRVKEGETVRAVARDLDVDKRQVYAWIYKAERAAASEATVGGSRGASRWQNRQTFQGRGRPPAADSEAETLRQENWRLKQALADKTLEVDFFKGALHKIEARRRPNTKPGATTSTPKSGN